MRIMRAVWCLGMAMALPGLAVGAAEVPIGTVIALEGQAEALPSDGAPRTLALKSPVHKGDGIKTGPASKVQISLSDESIISLGSDSLIVMDEYVYGGKETRKEDVNCVVSAAKGVLRMVTGKITDMNPDRFTVKTRLATIGIRGCELGFRLDEHEEQFYVLDLPLAHTVWVSWFKPGDPSPVVDILTAGTLASLRVGGVLESRDIPSTDLRGLLQEALPKSSQSDKPSGTEVQEFSQDGDKSSTDFSQQVAAGLQTETLSELTAAAESAAVSRSRGMPTEEDLPPLPTEGPSAPPYVPPPPPEDPGPPVLVGGNPDMDDWDWGIWENGDVLYEPNSYVAADFISPSDFATLAGDTTTYDLVGFGMAGAVLQDNIDGVTRVVDGACQVDVIFGGGETPAWGGTFNLSNGSGDSLDIVVDRASGGGVINSDGTLSLDSLNSYSMTVNGHSYDDTSLSAQSVEGGLVVPGAGITPVSGVTGAIHFEHGSDATVNGAFGATFF